MDRRDPFSDMPTPSELMETMGDNNDPEKAKQIFLEYIRMNAEIMDDPEFFSPDTYGGDRLFLEHFCTEEMEYDFPLIARDFLLHEYSNLTDHEDIPFLDYDDGDLLPEEAMIRFVLNLMMNAVNSGSEYARSLFVYLHKTYYKAEYKSLKRFSSISAEELFSLATTGGHALITNLARILTIAKMYGIEIKTDCGFVYLMLNDFYEKRESNDYFAYAESVRTRYQESLINVEEQYDEERLYKLESDASKFLGNVLRWLAYSPDYVEMCDENDLGLQKRLANTLSILTKMYPDRDFTAEELILYGTILHATSALTCNMDRYTSILSPLFYGEKGTVFYENFPSKFHPEDVMNVPVQQKKKERDRDKKDDVNVKAGAEPPREEEFLAEIESLSVNFHDN